MGFILVVDEEVMGIIEVVGGDVLDVVGCIDVLVLEGILEVVSCVVVVVAGMLVDVVRCVVVVVDGVIEVVG